MTEITAQFNQSDILASFENVTKTYGRKVALDNVSFVLRKAKIIGLLGPNGSGKTTAIKLLNGLIQPNSGKIEIDGEAPGVHSKSIISYLPDKNYLNDWMSINKLLDFFSTFYEDFDVERARVMLKNLDLNPEDSLKTLSKGNKEKVQLILAMSRRAKLYILDEPIGGVDPAARDYILSTIIGNYSNEASILISTHLISDVEKVLDDVIIINNGSIYIQDSVDNIRIEQGKSVDELFREVFRC